MPEHDVLARRVARESIVMLKNEQGVSSIAAAHFLVWPNPHTIRCITWNTSWHTLSLTLSLSLSLSLSLRFNEQPTFK